MFLVPQRWLLCFRWYATFRFHRSASEGGNLCNACVTLVPPPALDSFGFPQHITSSLLDPASCFPDASKVEPVTPALPCPDDALYNILQIPTLSPSLLFTPTRPPMHLPPSTALPYSVSSPIPITKPSGPTKTISTDIRRGVTPSSLVPLHAPTQSRNYSTPFATSRKLVPVVFKAKKRGRQEVKGGGGEEEESKISLDPSTMGQSEGRIP